LALLVSTTAQDQTSKRVVTALNQNFAERTIRLLAKKIYPNESQGKERKQQLTGRKQHHRW